MKECKDEEVLKLCAFMLNFADNDNGMYIVKPVENQRFYIAVAYNSKNEHYRFAGVSAKNSTVSPIYYYDICKKTLGNCNKEEIYDFIDLSLIGPPLEFERDVSTEEGIREILIELRDRKIRPNRYVYSIFNTIMCEIMDYFGDNPCLNAHTIEMQVGQYTNELCGMQILSIIKDKQGNFKNIDDTKLINIKTLAEREDYINKHYDDLINHVV